MKLKQLILTGLGFAFMGLALLGVFLPVLPTTPFVLVAAGCFSSSSERLYKKLLANPALGPYLENYKSGTGITKSRKFFAIAFLWTGLVLSMLLVNRLEASFVLSIVGICVTVHLATIKTRTEESEDKEKTTAL